MKPKCCFGNNVDRMPEYLVDALRELQRDANRERHLLELDGDLDEYEIDICIAGFISTEAAMLVKDMTASLPPTSKAWCVAHNDWCPIFPHLCPGGHHFITAIAVLFEPARHCHLFTQLSPPCEFACQRAAIKSQSYSN